MGQIIFIVKPQEVEHGLTELSKKLEKGYLVVSSETVLSPQTYGREITAATNMIIYILKEPDVNKCVSTNPIGYYARGYEKD